jgi:hypothetical protein
MLDAIRAITANFDLNAVAIWNTVQSLTIVQVVILLFLSRSVCLPLKTRLTQLDLFKQSIYLCSFNILFFFLTRNNEVAWLEWKLELQWTCHLLEEIDPC